MTFVGHSQEMPRIKHLLAMAIHKLFLKYIYSFHNNIVTPFVNVSLVWIIIV